MRLLIRRVLFYRLLPVLCTLLTIVLLSLPGSIVPGTGLFNIKHFDKLIHIVLFAIHVFVWGVHFQSRSSDRSRFKKQVIYVVVASVLLGVIMEFVQGYFISNRSFDAGDILANTVGSLLMGAWLLRN